jgi:hypothetical protein
MARDGIERLFARGLISRDARQAFEEKGAISSDHINAREYQRDKRGAGFSNPPGAGRDDKDTHSSRGHIDRDKPSTFANERMRGKAEDRPPWPSVKQVRRVSANEWSPDWYGSQGRLRGRDVARYPQSGRPPDRAGNPQRLRPRQGTDGLACANGRPKAARIYGRARRPSTTTASYTACLPTRSVRLPSLSA